MPSLKRGQRNEIWHGFYMKKKRPPDKVREYMDRREELLRAANEQMSSYRIFVAGFDRISRDGADRKSLERLLARIEAATMDALYAGGGPVSSVPDRGMKLASRWANETPICIRNVSPAQLHGLPSVLSV
jgi:hypothetical protein